LGKKDSIFVRNDEHKKLLSSLTMALCTPIPPASNGIVPFGNVHMAAAYEQVPDRGRIPVK
jgi:hypothetical protein